MSTFRRAICTAVSLFVLICSARAQDSAKTNVTVSVVDPAGAVIPRSTVRALADGKEVSAEITGPDGKATLRLAPGSYELRAEDDPGFRPEKAQLQIAGGSTVSYTFRLQLGECSNCVSVQNFAYDLETWSPPLDNLLIFASAVPQPMTLRSIRGFVDAPEGHP